MDVPETRYARSGEISIAYQALGDGPPDLVFAPAIAHLELDWECLSEARFYSRLASACRLILFNLRGVGMSDRIPGVATLESRMDDIRAVMDATESERAVIFGLGDAGPLCVLFAAMLWRCINARLSAASKTLNILAGRQKRVIASCLPRVVVGDCSARPGIVGPSRAEIGRAARMKRAGGRC